LLCEHRSESRCGAAGGRATFLYTNIRLRHQRNKTTVGRIVLHICRETTAVAYLVAAQNCSGFGIYLSALRERFSTTEWQYPRFELEYIQLQRGLPHVALASAVCHQLSIRPETRLRACCPRSAEPLWYSVLAQPEQFIPSIIIQDPHDRLVATVSENLADLLAA
jgi:hypothetical protein